MRVKESTAAAAAVAIGNLNYVWPLVNQITLNSIMALSFSRRLHCLPNDAIFVLSKLTLSSYSNSRYSNGNPHRQWNKKIKKEYSPYLFHSMDYLILKRANKFNGSVGYAENIFYCVLLWTLLAPATTITRNRHCFFQTAQSNHPTLPLSFLFSFHHFSRSPPARAIRSRCLLESPDFCFLFMLALPLKSRIMWPL